MSAARIAQALGGARRSGEWWSCLCPVHPDRQPSLALRDGDRGLIVRCFDDAFARYLSPESVTASHCKDSRDFADPQSVTRRGSVTDGIDKNAGIPRQVTV